MSRYKSQEPTGGSDPSRSGAVDFEVVKLISSSAARHHPGDFHLLRPGGLSGKAVRGLT